MNYLVLSVQGENTKSLVSDLVKDIKDCRCNIIEGHTAVMGDQFVGMMMLAGTWDAIAKIEGMIPRLKELYKLHIFTTRTKQLSSDVALVPYTINAISFDQTGIVCRLAHFMIEHDLIIQEINTQNYRASHTNTEMFSLHMLIHIPATVSIASVRGDFIDFCDDLNIDAVMEPVDLK